MSETILVVEDEPALRDTLSYNLKKDGFSVEAVGDGRAALDSARKLRPDLIVLDLMGDLACRSQDLRRGEAIWKYFHDMGLHLLADARNAHHEKLVHVRAEDGKELQPFEQWIGFIQGFVEDAALEFEQAEFSVDK